MSTKPDGSMVSAARGIEDAQENPAPATTGLAGSTTRAVSFGIKTKPTFKVSLIDVAGCDVKINAGVSEYLGTMRLKMEPADAVVFERVLKANGATAVEVTDA